MMKKWEIEEVSEKESDGEEKKNALPTRTREHKGKEWLLAVSSAS